MNTHSGNKVNNAIGGSVGVVGGLVLWINTHLGTAFYALLLLIFLNVVAALWEKDLLKSVHKWLKVIMGVAVPFAIPTLTRSQGIVWTDGDSKFLVGAIFAALLSTTIPDLLGVINRFMTTWNVPKNVQDSVDTTTTDRLARLEQFIMSQYPAPDTVVKADTQSAPVSTPVVDGGVAGVTPPPTHGV